MEDLTKSKTTSEEDSILSPYSLANLSVDFSSDFAPAVAATVDLALATASSDSALCHI